NQGGNHMRKMGFALSATVALMGLALPGNALGQAVNVADFSCGTTPFSVNVDVKGLGNIDVCVTSTATVNLSCACVNNSGSCPQAANKATTPTTFKSSATLQPKNGRVHTREGLSTRRAGFYRVQGRARGFA